MFTVSVYSGGRFVGHQTVLGEDWLSPASAKAALRAEGFSNGAVFQDNHITRDGQIGTVMYRVYQSGRTRRKFFPYLEEKTPFGTRVLSAGNTRIEVLKSNDLPF